MEDPGKVAAFDRAHSEPPPSLQGRARAKSVLASGYTASKSLQVHVKRGEGGNLNLEGGGAESSFVGVSMKVLCT